MVSKKSNKINGEIVPHSEPFRRVHKIIMSDDEVKDKVAKFSLIISYSLFIDNFVIDSNVFNELCDANQEELCKLRVDRLVFRYISKSELSDSVFQTINKISPNSVNFECISSYDKSEILNLGFMKICSEVDCAEISIGISEYLYKHEFKLEFTNVTIKVYDDENQNSVFVKCKHFDCFLGIKKLNYWYSVDFDKNDSSYLHIIFDLRIEFSKICKITDQSEIYQAFREFEGINHLFKGCGIVIPMLKLYKLSMSNIEVIINEIDENNDFFEQILKAREIHCNIYRFDHLIQLK